MTTREWHESGSIFNYEKFDIFFVDNHADGDVILLLHGFPTASWDWHKMWNKLTDGYRLIAPDFLGFGFSSKPYPFPYSISIQTDIVEALLDHLGIDRCFIIAHDYAVSVVQELLWRKLSGNSTCSSEFEKIILLNGGLFPETHQARPIQKLLLGRWGWLINRLLTKRSLSKNLNQIFGPKTPPTEDEIDAFWELINYNQGKRCFHLLIRYMNDRVDNRENWLEALRQTKTPIKLVNGPEDPISGIHMVRRYQELIPDPDVHLLSGIGHYPNVEAPDEVVIVASDFFGPAQV